MFVFVVKRDKLYQPVCTSADTPRMMCNDVLSLCLNCSRRSQLPWLAVSPSWHQPSQLRQRNTITTVTCRMGQIRLCTRVSADTGRGTSLCDYVWNRKMHRLQASLAPENYRCRLRESVCYCCCLLLQAVTLDLCPLPCVWQTRTCLHNITAGLSLCLVIVVTQSVHTHVLCLTDMCCVHSHNSSPSCKHTNELCDIHLHMCLKLLASNPLWESIPLSMKCDFRPDTGLHSLCNHH